MTNVLIIGATGTIAQFTREFLEDDPSVQVFPYVRNINKLENQTNAIIGDATDQAQLVSAIKEHHIDLVYSNLGPYNMVQMATSVLNAIQETNVKRIIWMATSGIYDELPESHKERAKEMLGETNDPSSYMGDQRAAADMVAESGLEYTIIRPNWLQNGSEVEEVRITHQDEKLSGGPINRITVGSFIADLIRQPNQYIDDSIAVSTDSDKNY
ncbi:NAD(P)H-binding protein [Pediococcus claussenii]|uniref:NAD dependent epimerase/dehydratase family protein n=1 Tax=Pediococcus claussenii (strain ATCC BAA-344 / DSM 14800 / JCM 18046 / KCTC 3811 / LMG 21948 / P06) TaxID=701521 RepID=G8PAT9_PEDCP|nr:NAD(P)H-binding protein [Pediococcus claussenii]AEV95807.1 NAD dependent epimerase/dehydratase family protein [Pediococcus claussenii ATCC BAA-344]ANZ69305.1 hypothetical protein AYR57_02860 [Pediococcus claussenii]ANZ71125.1 hypothetical protein AYR58_02875 [Pediococcus claussenii]KRN20414.1 hypothetical protein IV79_GL000469 [Pediococcus claussenii]